MKQARLRATVISVVAVLALAFYFYVARILLLEYSLKSAIKLVLFFGLPLCYWLIWAKRPIKDILKSLLPKKDQLRSLLILLAAGLAIIIAANLLFEPICRFFQLDSVIAAIKQGSNTTREKMLIVSIYIPVVNALAEEFFFRFFYTLELTALGFRRYGFIFPATIFSLYHLAIFNNWFSPLLMILALVALFFCGLFLNWMVRRQMNIVGVWLIHGLVNVAINIIGLRAFS